MRIDMKTELLRKLRTEIRKHKRKYNAFGVLLEIQLYHMVYSVRVPYNCGKARENELYKELEHLALAGYVKQQREK